MSEKWGFCHGFAHPTIYLRVVRFKRKKRTERKREKKLHTYIGLRMKRVLVVLHAHAQISSGVSFPTIMNTMVDRTVVFASIRNLL